MATSCVRAARAFGHNGRLPQIPLASITTRLCMHDHDHPHAPPPVGSDRPIGLRRSRPFDAPAFEAAITALLQASGLADDEAHTGRTAERVRELWQKRLLGGYDLDPASVLGEGFADPREDMVMVRSIAVHGVCPHHLVPFRGLAHVAYLPGGRLPGRPDKRLPPPAPLLSPSAPVRSDPGPSAPLWPLPRHFWAGR